MPRIVPSQVIAAIDQLFPFAANQPAAGVQLYEGHSAHVAALLGLVEQIPDNLLTPPPPHAVPLTISLAVIRHALEMWRAHIPGAALNVIPGHGQLNPVTIVRNALAACPDEAPSPGTASLAFIIDQELRNSIRLDISAANTDLANGEWKGTTVLAGSAVEALLLWALQQHEAHHPGDLAAAGAALVATGTLGDALHQNPERWDLNEYVEVAAHLAIISPDTMQQVRLTRRFRNLIHPGRAQRLGQKCDRSTALTALASVEAVARDLTPP